MMAGHSTKRRPRIVVVIASGADLERALRMRRLPDLFELRLDHLADMADDMEKMLSRLRTPLIITARDPHEGGANKLRLRQRRDLLLRFLNHADYIDVELRSARALQSLLANAKTKKVGRIISFHNFGSTPSARILAAKARQARVTWRGYFQSCYAHRHANGTRTFARIHDKQPFESFTCRHGNRQTWVDFSCSARARRLCADLRIGERNYRRRRTTLAGTTPRTWHRMVGTARWPSVSIGARRSRPTKHVRGRQMVQSIHPRHLPFARHA